MNSQQPCVEPDYTYYHLNPITYKPVYERSCYMTSHLSGIEDSTYVYTSLKRSWMQKPALYAILRTSIAGSYARGAARQREASRADHPPSLLEESKHEDGAV